MSIIFNSAGIAETMNNGVSNVTGTDSIITENYTNVVQHGIKIDMSVREKTISGTPPLSFNSNGTPLLDFFISGNMVQNGTPTPDNPIHPSECGDLETSGTKAGQYKIPISSANTTTPVYLGEVETTRKIKKYEVTGQENWDVNASSNVFFANIDDALGAVGVVTAICSHYNIVENKTSYNQVPNNSICIRANASTLWIKDTDYDSGSYYKAIEDFKAYLAQQYANGTPVTVWYVLVTEETGIVNEPLRKIGDYADTLSMEQAGVTIPTASGSNTINVDTTLKPSNISITYKGR